MMKHSISKSDALQLLEQAAFFAEYQGENPFKVRAFQNAVQVLEDLTETDFQERLKEKSLIELKGIGKGIASALEELAEKGQWSELAKLRADVPPQLFEMLKLRGLGVKKVKLLYEELGLKSIGELEYACRENRLTLLSGFGEKTQSKILKEIQFLKERAGKKLLSDGLRIFSEWTKELSKLGMIHLVGALARRLEVIDQIEIVLTDPKPHPKTLQAVENLSFIKKAELHADQIKAVSNETIPLIIHLRSKEESVAAQIFLTSSELHWMSLQKQAETLGGELSTTQLKLKKKIVLLASQEEFYRALSLVFHSPECRELPAHDLDHPPFWVSSNDLRGAFHIHTSESDGIHSLDEMASSAERAGWHYAGISDHSQTAAYARGLDSKRLAQQAQSIDAWNAQNHKLFIFKGIESDILKDGSLDYPDHVLEELDFVIASIHNRYGQTEMTDRLLGAIQKKYTTMIGHITGRLLLARDAYGLDWKRVIKAAIENRVIIELNAHPQRLDPDWRILAEACRQGLIVSLNPDAHAIEGYDDLHYAIGMARKAEIPKKQIFNTWSLMEVTRWFQSKH